jgi:hypothetical protein
MLPYICVQDFIADNHHSEIILFLEIDKKYGYTLVRLPLQSRS